MLNFNPIILFAVSIVVLPLAVIATRPLTGDPNPSPYPVFNVHVEIPPQPLHPRSTQFSGFSTSAYEADVTAWRTAVARNLTAIANYTNRLLSALLSRDRLLSKTSSFLQAPDLGSALQDMATKGFDGILEGEKNFGPYPVLNIFLEDTLAANQTAPANGKTRSQKPTELKSLLKLHSRQLKDMQRLLKNSFIPLSLLQTENAGPNFQESNLAPYTEFDFFPEVTPANGGQDVPLAFPMLATIAATIVAKTLEGRPYTPGAPTVDTALLASLPGGAKKLLTKAQLEALILQLRMIKL